MITANITYYNEPHFLSWWYKKIKIMKEEYGLTIPLQICDDGSQRKPAEDFFDKHPPLDHMTLFLIPKDIGFNSHGARNLLMKHTKTKWNILSDIDRAYNAETLTRLYHRAGRGALKQGSYYKFQYHGKTRSAESLNDYIIHVDDFWLSGGYDEEFVNVHWGDRIFFESLRLFLKEEVQRDCYIQYTRHARNVSVGDVELTDYPDDNTLIIPKNSFWNDKVKREEMKAFIRNRNSTHEGRMSKKILNFEWEKVF